RVRRIFPCCSSNESRHRLRHGGDASVFFWKPMLASCFNGQDIGFERTGALLHKCGDAFGQDAAVECASNFNGPILMEMVKQTRRNSRPIVKRHVIPSSRAL